MFNFVAKFLVLIHTILSVAAMTWALYVFLAPKDVGWNEPRREVLKYDPTTGEPTEAVRHASAYDKSVIALEQADRTRKLLYVHVKPVLETIEKTEPHLYTNHLHYLAEMKRLQESPDKIEVRRLKEGGLFLEIPVVGQPIPEEKPVAVSKSYKMYREDRKKIEDELKTVESEIEKQIKDIKKFTAELTGTDEGNKYLYPGLYQLADREFKAQSQLKIEIDEIKPFWSQALEQARQLRIRRTDLEATLSKLKAAMPKTKKAL